jgi:hypothetical protein
MIPFIAVGLLIGGLLGVQFTVLAVVPVALCAFLIAAATLGLQGTTFGSIVVELTCFLAFLQIGYVSGAVIRSSSRKRVAPVAYVRQSPHSEASRKPTPGHH